VFEGSDDEVAVTKSGANRPLAIYAKDREERYEADPDDAGDARPGKWNFAGSSGYPGFHSVLSSGCPQPVCTKSQKALGTRPDGTWTTGCFREVSLYWFSIV